MRLETKISYPGASADQAFELILDPEFRADVCERTAALDYDVEVEQDEDGSATVRVRRVVPAQVPDLVKKLVGETIELVQVEEWAAPDGDGRRTAALTLDITGQPARLKGTVTLTGDDEGATETIEGDLKVSIPIIGRKVEPDIAKALVLAAKVEQKTGREWLAR